MDKIGILTHSIVNGTLIIWLATLGNSYFSATSRWLNKEKHLTINTIKLHFVKKTSSMLYPVKKIFKISRAIVRKTPDMLGSTKILSASTVKRLVVD